MKQHNQPPQGLLANTEHLLNSWQKNSENTATSTELMEEHRRIVKLLEKQLQEQLSWSLDRVYVRGESQSSLSDTNTVIPDIWIETLSNNPVSTNQVVETNLIISVLEEVDDGKKQAALERCLGINSLQVLVLIQLSKSTVEVIKRNRDGWNSVSYEGQEVVLIETIPLNLNFGEIWNGTLSSKRGSQIRDKTSRVDLPADASSSIVVSVKDNEKRFPYRPVIKAKESGRGYLLRVAEELEYKSPYIITKNVGCRVKEIDEIKLRELSIILRQPFEEFSKHFFTTAENSNDGFLLGKKLRRRFVNHSTPRLCPCCVSEDPVCSAAWDLNLVTVCPKHGCELIDACPKCKGKLTWVRSSVGKCSCGFDLSTIQTKRASKNALALTKVIYQTLGLPDEEIGETTNNYYCEELHALSLSGLLRAIHYLGATFHQSAEKTKQIDYRRNNLHEAIEVVEAASETISNWPHNYVERLRIINQKHELESEQEKTLTGVFGNYYLSLYKALADAEFRFLQKAFEQFLIAEWNGEISKNHRCFSDDVRIQQNWITACEASRLLDRLTVRAMQKLVNEGTLIGELRKKGPKGQRTQLWLERNSVEAWVEESKKWVPLPKVSALLGIHYRTVIKFGQIGLIKFQKGGLAAKGRSWNYLHADVSRIINAFEKHQVPVVKYVNRNERQIALQDTAHYLGSKKLAEVISAVIDGTLTPIARAGKFSGIRDYIFSFQQLSNYK